MPYPFCDWALLSSISFCEFLDCFVVEFCSFIAKFYYSIIRAFFFYKNVYLR